MDLILIISILLLTGIIAGFFAGLLGIGGGFLMVPVQYMILVSTGMDPTVAIRVAFGTSLAVVFPVSCAAAFAHHTRGGIDWGAAVPIGCAGLIGGFAGGTLASHLPADILKPLFGVMIIIAAIRMLTGTPVCRGEKDSCLFSWTLLGAIIGILSGLLGMGGGILLVPILLLFFNLPIHRAVGTSSACILFFSTGGILAYIVHGLRVADLGAGYLGYIDLLQWIILTGTMIPLSRLGVGAAHRLPAERLKRVFAGMMVIIGIVMIGILP
ncbi:putative membrane protein YfcA [Methanocalculus alkaliphilus]|uniref:sulfite exporter TauE/SafE family protein n=1 Tax=Methanocalculus alkaliphilus TaxID=768730 RepID=UPI00209E8ECC|nr:sulfite exporter TauE/SafE family protein [Methanocalculus alkaliphilus]MCP1714977.1 putative membrane protein YfcA [Methanocalculus alkaliphilus]